MKDIGRTLSWDALDSFLAHIDLDSALMREINPEAAVWASTLKTNAILADICDLLAHINANLVAHASGKPARAPKPYPRLNKQEPENERHFGRGAMPPDELRKWFEEKRAENAGSSTGDHNRNTGT